MNSDHKPAKMTLEVWRTRCAAFYNSEIRDDQNLLDRFYLKLSMHAHFAGRDAHGKPLHPEILQNHRDDFALEVARVRACPTYARLSEGDQKELERVAFQFPPDAGRDDAFGPPPKAALSAGAIPRRHGELVHDFAYNDPERLREPPNNALGYRELRDKMGYPRATKESVGALLVGLPSRKLTLGMVYIEDEYETKCGDGYFLYPERAYLTMAAAKKAAEWITEGSRKRHKGCGYRAEARGIEVVLDENGDLRVPRPKGVETINWEETNLIELINGNSRFGWLQTVEACIGPDAVEPDFDAEAERDRDNFTQNL